MMYVFESIEVIFVLMLITANECLQKFGQIFIQICHAGPCLAQNIFFFSSKASGSV